MPTSRQIVAGLSALVVAPLCTVAIFRAVIALSESMPTVGYIQGAMLPCISFAGVVIGYFWSDLFGAATLRYVAVGSVLGHLLLWIPVSGATLFALTPIAPVWIIYGGLVWLGYWAARV